MCTNKKNGSKNSVMPKAPGTPKAFSYKVRTGFRMPFNLLSKNLQLRGVLEGSLFSSLLSPPFLVLFFLSAYDSFIPSTKSLSPCLVLSCWCPLRNGREISWCKSFYPNFIENIFVFPVWQGRGSINMCWTVPKFHLCKCISWCPAVL